jgi:hypothetical protein
MVEELSSYIDKCRCCLGTLDESLAITKAIEKQFYFVSHVEVRDPSSNVYADYSDDLPTS